MSTEKMREEFQVWFAENYPKINREETAQDCLFKMIASSAWDHSRAAIEVELPPLSGMDSSFVADGIQKTREHNRYNAAVNDCRKAIKSLGLKVKQ